MLTFLRAWKQLRQLPWPRATVTIPACKHGVHHCAQLLREVERYALQAHSHRGLTPSTWPRNSPRLIQLGDLKSGECCKLHLLGS